MTTDAAIQDQIKISEKEFQEEIEHSYAVAKRLLPFLAKRNIPVTPNNYRIFFDYLLNTNPTLNNVINTLLNENAKFDHQFSSIIYEQLYYGDKRQSETLENAAKNFILVSDKMETSIKNVLDKTNYYKKVLHDKSKQMAVSDDASSLQTVLEELLNETEAALESNGIFVDSLNEASNTIASLKAELKAQKNLAGQDELTKLYNRRQLKISMPSLMKKALVNQEPLSLIVFDLDHFKRVNDNWGHVFGDKVLIICANIIKAAARAEDLPIRFGGEEFLLVLPGLKLDEAAQKAEQVRSSLANTDITIRGTSLMVTISAGVAQYEAGEDIDSFVNRADQALYHAKHDGRNLVRLAEASKGDAKDKKFTGVPL